MMSTKRDMCWVHSCKLLLTANIDNPRATSVRKNIFADETQVTTSYIEGREIHQFPVSFPHLHILHTKIFHARVKMVIFFASIHPTELSIIFMCVPYLQHKYVFDDTMSILLKIPFQLIFISHWHKLSFSKAYGEHEWRWLAVLPFGAREKIVESW